MKQYKRRKVLCSKDSDVCWPDQGGCWFCNSKTEDDMWFTFEFDAYFHMDCLHANLHRNPEWDDSEAEIIAREVNLGVEDFEEIC